MPDAKGNRLVCIAAISSSHCSIAAAGACERAAATGTRPFHMEFSYWKRRQLLGGYLPRRIECAGIVDFSYLVITEPEDLPQDFVGVFPK